MEKQKKYYTISTAKTERETKGTANAPISPVQSSTDVLCNVQAGKTVIPNHPRGLDTRNCYT